MSKKSRQYQKLLGMILSAAILATGITACSGKTDHATGEANHAVTEETESGSVSETAVFQATVLEIQDGSCLVEPVEGSPELKSADQIIVALNEAESSPELEAGDIIEITYDGMIAETYPAQISNVFRIRVVEKHPSSEETKEEEILRKNLAELAEQYGILTSEQTGTMHSGTDQWFDPEGLISASIMDFDSDGMEEMVVFVPEECSHTYEGSRHIRMDMWEVEDGQAVLSDSMIFGAYVESVIYPGNRIEVPFPAPFGSEEMILVYAIPGPDSLKLVCGARYGISFFADGSWRGYWVLEYADGKFQYDSSFTCPGPGSAGFEFTGYEFSDGICTGSKLYYCELEGNGIYESYEDAFTGFFQKQGLEMAGEAGDYGSNWNACDHLLSASLDAQPDAVKIISFVNEMTDSSFDKETFEQTAEFMAALSRGNDLLDIDQ